MCTLLLRLTESVKQHNCSHDVLAMLSPIPGTVCLISNDCAACLLIDNSQTCQTKAKQLQSFNRCCLIYSATNGPYAKQPHAGKGLLPACTLRKTALQESGAFLPLSCGLLRFVLLWDPNKPYAKSGPVPASNIL